MNLYLSEEDVFQNLKDAGCDEETIQTFMDNLQNGKQVKGMRLLENHRRGLLDNLHEEQKRIDCLDYLLFVLKKQKP